MLHRRAFLQGMAFAAATGPTALRAQVAPMPDSDFVSIGGIAQWISIRRAAAADPVMLFLHGGPGEALSPFAELLAPWQRAFTVVLWDQRGAGRTFGRDRAGQGEMSLVRLTTDTVALAEHLRTRLGKEKIVLAGQSWGSILGWSAIQARPDLFAAYVGTGQSVSWRRAVPVQEAHAAARAEAAGDREAVAALAAARRLPIDDTRRTSPLRRWIMPPSDLGFIETQRRLLGPPPLPETGEVADWVAGFEFSAQALTPAVLAFDAYASPSAAIPVITIQGRDDLITPTDLVRRFVTDLRAPARAAVEIEGGHFACYTNPRGFADALATQVRPLVA